MAVRATRVLSNRCHRLAGRPPQRGIHPLSCSSASAGLASRRHRPSSSLDSTTATPLSVREPTAGLFPSRPKIRSRPLFCGRPLAVVPVGVAIFYAAQPWLLLQRQKQDPEHARRAHEQLLLVSRRTLSSYPRGDSDEQKDDNNAGRAESTNGRIGGRSGITKSGPAVVEPGHERERTRIVDKEAARIWTLPNMITMGRICFCPVLAGLIVTSHHDLALAGLLVASLSDWLDGYIAREWDQKSVLGGFLDPLADKIMVTTVALALGHQGILPAALVALMVGRDTLLIAGATFYRYKTKKEEHAFFDVQSLDYKVKPTMLSKANTALQFGALWLGLTHAVYSVPNASLFSGICYTTGAATVASGIDYLLESGLKPKGKLGQRLMINRELVRRRYRREEAAMQERMRIRRERRRARGSKIRDRMRMSPKLIARAVKDRISRGRQTAKDTGAGVRGRLMRGRDTVKTMMVRQRARMQERAANRASRRTKLP